MAMQNIIDYAELHQYHLQLSGHVDKDRHPAWSKVKAWQNLLQRYDWVWQTDADMAILDMHRRLETFLDSDYDIIIGRDCSTFHDLLDHGFNASEALRASVNTGSFFLRSSPWTSDFLRKLYEYNGSHIPNIDIWWDNAAMIHFIQMDQSLDTHIKLVPGRLFNAWPPSTLHYFRERNNSHLCDHTETVFYEPGDFAIHFVASSKPELTAYLSASSEVHAQAHDGSKLHDSGHGILGFAPWRHKRSDNT